jgi:hypothetical protein
LYYFPGKHIYPNDLDSVRINVSDVRKFAKAAQEIGVQYVGICCGNCAVYFRELAESYGRKPPASLYSPDTSKSYVFGSPLGHRNAHSDKIREFMLDVKR